VSFRLACVTARRLHCYVQSSAEVGEFERQEQPVYPEPIVQLQWQLDQFCSTQPNRAKIPEGLWQAAVELTRQHELYAVAQLLRLDYVGLKRRLEGVSKLEKKKKVASPGFVELNTAHPAETECVIEFESKSGRKMRIQWKGAGAPDWSSLLREWLEAEQTAPCATWCAGACR
jgi:hypothetical protein